jgi:hypothetical protein
VINSTVLNMVHIQTIGGLDAELMVQRIVMVVGFIAMLLWIKL